MNRAITLRTAVDVAQLIGALAVLIGLIFVGVEVRRNTAAVQASTNQQITDSSSGFLMHIAADSQMTRIWREGRADPDQLKGEDATRFALLMRAWWVRMQNAFSQWERGTLTDNDWRGSASIICAMRKTDRGIAASFEDVRPLLSRGFVEFLTRCGYGS